MCNLNSGDMGNEITPLGEYGLRIPIDPATIKEGSAPSSKSLRR